MRFIRTLSLAVALLPLGAMAQQVSVAPKPFVVEQTYWIKPGKELQYIGLFEKTQVPLLQAKIKDGRVLWVRMTRPNFNATIEQWDLQVTVAWRDPESAMAQPPQLKSQLTTEQQIMDELVLEHTDVPVQQWNVNAVGAP